MPTGLCDECKSEPAMVRVDWRDTRRGQFCQACFGNELGRISAEARLDRGAPEAVPPLAPISLGLCSECGMAEASVAALDEDMNPKPLCVTCSK